MHTYKEVQFCRLSTTITHNDHVFLAILSSFLINFQKYQSIIYHLYHRSNIGQNDLLICTFFSTLNQNRLGCFYLKIHPTHPIHPTP